MDSIIISKEKIVLKFSEDDLMLICNSLNEVYNGIEGIGASFKDVEMLLKFISFNFDKVEQFRRDEMNIHVFYREWEWKNSKV